MSWGEGRAGHDPCARNRSLGHCWCADKGILAPRDRGSGVGKAARGCFLQAIRLPGLTWGLSGLGQSLCRAGVRWAGLGVLWQGLCCEAKLRSTGKGWVGEPARGLAQPGSAPAEASCDQQPCSSPTGKPGSLPLPWALGESQAPEGLWREGR